MDANPALLSTRATSRVAAIHWDTQTVYMIAPAGKLSADALVPFLSKIAKASATESGAGQEADSEEAGGSGGAGGGAGGEAGSKKAERPPPPILALDLQKLDELLDTDDVWLIAAFEGAAAARCRL